MIDLRLTEYDTGVQIITCRLGDVAPPAGEVIASFEDVNRAIQDRVFALNSVTFTASPSGLTVRRIKASAGASHGVFVMLEPQLVLRATRSLPSL